MPDPDLHSTPAPLTTIEFACLVAIVAFLSFGTTFLLLERFGG